MGEPDDKELMRAAIERDGEAQRAALAGDWQRAWQEFHTAAGRYRASWEAAGPSAYGRLVGMLKSAILAGEPSQAAAYARAQIGANDAGSPVAAYALAVAALVEGADEEADRHAAVMAQGPPAAGRAAAAIQALAAGDAAGYRGALEAIVDDFAGRAEHLTGVPIADTAMMLEALAAARGMEAHPLSPLVPAPPR